MALPKHLNIVSLESFFAPLPPRFTVPPPYTFNITQHHRTTVAEVPSRIKDAHVLITTTLPIGADALSSEAAPNLKLIAVVASGTDAIDLNACKERGIRVLNSPGCNVDAVAEHAVALYFAARRSLVPSVEGLRAGDWPRKRSLIHTAFVAGNSPPGCRDETVVIVGYGGVGRRLETLFSGLGMKVIIAARKNTPAATGRVPFEEALKMASVVVVCCPRNPETQGMISGPEFGVMRNDAVLVNVARGGIVAEDALLQALRDGEIAGAGVDVFDREPASPETSVLLGPEARGLNLVTTPHTAWIGTDTTSNNQRVLQENINGFILGDMVRERIKA